MRRLAIRFDSISYPRASEYLSPGLPFIGTFSLDLSPILWRRRGSNPQPPACKAGALPIELRPRTLQPGAHAPRLAKLGAHGLEPWTSALSGLRSSQLSYAPLVKQKSQTMLVWPYPHR